MCSWYGEVFRCCSIFIRSAAGQVSERNLRRALLSFETCRVAQYPLTDSQPVQLPDWELYIQVLYSYLFTLILWFSCLPCSSHAYRAVRNH